MTINERRKLTKVRYSKDPKSKRNAIERAIKEGVTCYIKRNIAQEIHAPKEVLKSYLDSMMSEIAFLKNIFGITLNINTTFKSFSKLREIDRYMRFGSDVNPFDVIDKVWRNHGLITVMSKGPRDGIKFHFLVNGIEKSGARHDFKDAQTCLWLRVINDAIRCENIFTSDPLKKEIDKLINSNEKILCWPM